MPPTSRPPTTSPSGCLAAAASRYHPLTLLRLPSARTPGHLASGPVRYELLPAHSGLTAVGYASHLALAELHAACFVTADGITYGEPSRAPVICDLRPSPRRLGYAACNTSYPRRLQGWHRRADFPREGNDAMSRSTRIRSAGATSPSLLMALVVSSIPVAGRDTVAPAAAPQQQSADLSRALGADGTFRGAQGVAGTVDTSAWTLVSDVAAGEAPRFAPAVHYVSPASPVSPSATGPWSALGSNGSGNGALNNEVWTLAVSGSDLFVLAASSPMPRASRRPTTSPSGTAAPGPPWARTARATEPSTTVSEPSRSPAATSTWVASSTTPRANPRPTTLRSGTAASGRLWARPARGNGALNDAVYALAVSGDGLYVGGVFTNVAGHAKADTIAKWTAAPGRPWARTATATGPSTTWSSPSRSPAPISTWAVASPTLRASIRPTTSPSGTAAPGPPGLERPGRRAVP